MNDSIISDSFLIVEIETIFTETPYFKFFKYLIISSIDCQMYDFLKLTLFISMLLIHALQDYSNNNVFIQLSNSSVGFNIISNNSFSDGIPSDMIKVPQAIASNKKNKTIVFI